MFCQTEYIFRQSHAYIGTGIHAHCVVATEAAESERNYSLTQTYTKAALVFEPVKHFRGAHFRVKESGGLTVDVIEYVVDTDCSVSGYIKIADSGHSHKTVTLIAERRV